MNIGSAFADNRGHVIVSYEHTQRDAILGSQLPFFFFGGQGANLAYGAYSPGTAPLGAAPNLPSQAAINNYFAAYGAPPGAVKNSTSLGFNGNGTLFTPVTPWYNYQESGLVGTPASSTSVGCSRPQSANMPT